MFKVFLAFVFLLANSCCLPGRSYLSILGLDDKSVVRNVILMGKKVQLRYECYFDLFTIWSLKFAHEKF